MAKVFVGKNTGDAISVVVNPNFFCVSDKSITLWFGDDDTSYSEIALPKDVKKETVAHAVADFMKSDVPGKFTFNADWKYCEKGDEE